jgi:hypothetical protein
MRWLRASDAILFKTFEKNNLPALGFRHHKEREESPEETNASKSSWKALYRAGIFKPLWSPGIDAKASTPPAYVAWRAGTITLFLVGA